MPLVCIQFQPDRILANEEQVRQAMRESFPDATVSVGIDHGRFENMWFEVESTEIARTQIRVVFDSSDLGRLASTSCIVTCQGKHGWDDYILLHHYDPAEMHDNEPRTK